MAKLQKPIKPHLRIPLIFRTVVSTIVIGIALWIAADTLGKRTVEKVLRSYMTSVLNHEALEHRLNFNRVVSMHYQIAKVMSTQRGLTDYIEGPSWTPHPVGDAVLHQRPPAWMPDNTFLRSFVAPRFFLLIDEDGITREAYSTRGDKPPVILLDIPARLLMLSRQEGHLTSIGGIPFIVSSEEIRGSGKDRFPSILVASPVDSDFLAASTIGNEFNDMVIALVDREGKVFVSSNPGVIPRDMSLDIRQKDFIAIGQDFLEYGGSELNFRFVAFIHRHSVDNMMKPIISKSRLTHTAQAVLFIFAFVLIMFFNARRIKRMTAWVTDFSKEALGGQHVESGHWDEIYELEERFRIFMDEIRSSNETIKREAAEITRAEGEIASKDRQLRLLQSVTESTGTGVAIVIEGEVVPLNSLMEQYCDNYGEPDCFNLRDGSDREMEVEFKDGSIHVFRVMTPDLRMDTKVVLAMDITDQKKALKDIMQSKKDWESTFDSITDMITIYDRDFNVIRANNAARELVNLPVFKDQKGGFLRFFHKEDQRQMFPVLDCLYSGNSYNTEIYLQELDMHMEINVLPRMDASRKVRGLIHVARDITQRKKLEEDLRRSALYDSMTALPNRALFMDRLDNLFDLMDRERDMLFAVLFIDLDNFKKVNDSLGHTIGDEVLKTVAARLLGCVRPGDTVSRFGGDEFAIILGTLENDAEAVVIAQRIRDELKKPLEAGGMVIYSTSSIGLSISHRGYKGSEEMLRDADTAMYHAKARGRDCYMVFDDHMHFKVLESLNIEIDLRNALERDEFRLFYQPIINIVDSHVFGYEALLRWKHPIKGILSPDDFITIAEESGQIVDIGRWVLREACMQLRDMQDPETGVSPHYVSVNVSARQLTADLPDMVRECIIETGVMPEGLRLEITESLLMDNPELALEILVKLRNMNIHIYLDDFGTGYSSLNYIHKFPIDGLKVDRSFVQNIVQDKDAQEIVRAIVSLAHTLDMDVIVEGVEKLEQLEVFRNMGCRLIQGYYFSQPFDTKALESYNPGAEPLS